MTKSLPVSEGCPDLVGLVFEEDGAILGKIQVILNSSFFILHSSFFILNSSFSILHSSFSILHSQFFIPSGYNPAAIVLRAGTM